MANASCAVPKRGNILKCPTCHAKMTEPRALPCFHLFCQRCVDDMQLIEGESVPTVECPACLKYTTKNMIRPMDCIKELYEVIGQSKQKNPIRCDKCKTETLAKWRCLDCKENFCAACRDAHNGFSFLENHQWKELSSTEIKIVLDKRVYCQHQDHKGELVKLYCKDCQELICLLCNATEHKTHEVETIMKATENVVPVIKEKMCKLKEIIEANQAILEDTTIKGEERKKRYEDIEREADRKCEEIMRKARDDCKKIKQQLQDIRNDEFRQIERFRKQNEATIKSQQNTLTLVEGALENAKGSSLLQLLHSAARDTVESMTLKGTGLAKNVFGNFTVLNQATVPKENLIGNLEFVSQLEKHKVSDYIDSSLIDMCHMASSLTMVKEVLEKYSKLCHIDQELWFVKYDSDIIDIYDVDCIKIRSVQYEQIENLRSAKQLGSKLILAASNGLFIADFKGNVEFRVIECNACDVSVMGDMFYVLDNDASKVHILKVDIWAKRLTVQGEMVVQNYEKCPHNTIQVTKKGLYISLYWGDQIQLYDHDGIRQAIFNHCNTLIDQSLFNPTLCGVDADGSLLVARVESGVSNIVILTTDGEWYCPPIYDIQHPRCVCVHNDTLWAYDWERTICMKYRFQ